MKKSFVVLLTGFSLLLSISAYPQSSTEVIEVDSLTGATKTTKYTRQDPPKTNMLAVNPITFLDSYNLSYYHSLSRYIAVGAGFTIQPTDWEGTYYGGSAEVRYYPFAKFLSGFYLAPRVSYYGGARDYIISVEHDYSDPYSQDSLKYYFGSASTFAPGLMVGWQKFIANDFAIGVAVGLNYRILVDEKGTDKFGNSLLGRFDGIKPTFRFDIGYAW